MNYIRLGSVCALLIVTYTVCSELFVKPRPSSSRHVSASSLREECCTLLADILEQCNSQARKVLILQQTTMDKARACLEDDKASFVAQASKDELMRMRDKLREIKQRCSAHCTALEDMERTVRTI